MGKIVLGRVRTLGSVECLGHQTLGLCALVDGRFQCVLRLVLFLSQCAGSASFGHDLMAACNLVTTWLGFHDAHARLTTSCVWLGRHVKGLIETDCRVQSDFCALE